MMIDSAAVLQEQLIAPAMHVSELEVYALLCLS